MSEGVEPGDEQQVQRRDADLAGDACQRVINDDRPRPRLESDQLKARKLISVQRPKGGSNNLVSTSARGNDLPNLQTLRGARLNMYICMSNVQHNPMGAFKDKRN